MKTALKNISIGCLLLTMIIKASSAQEYVPFPDSNAVWQVTYIDCMPPPPFGYNHYYHYIIDGDTLVNNLTYQKIYKIDFDFFCTNIFSDPYYSGAIRDNESEKRVYYLPVGYDQDTLLYDFSLEVGDTLPHSYVNFLDYYVESVDSILINNHFSKRFLLSAEYFPSALYLIEGIGSTTGLLEEMYDFEEGGNLRCFELNDTLNSIRLYNDTSYCVLPTDTCYLVNIKEESHSNISYVIYPNPSIEKKIHLEIENQDLPLRIEVYDLLGQLVYLNTLFEINNDIEFRELGSGVFILTLRNSRKTVSTKLILN